MNYETLKYSEEGLVGILTLSRPKALNALNKQLLTELDHFLSGVEDKNIRCLVVTGDGDKSFVAGADIKEMQDRDPQSGFEMAETGQSIFQKLEDLNIPTIAAVNGFALGGGLELAMSCDFIVASKKAKMGLPEVSLGLIPGYGGTQRLSRFAGKAVARMMTLTGDIYSATTAYELGLVAKLVEPEELMEEVLKMAHVIATRSPIALALAKKSINKGYDQEQLHGLKTEAFLFSEAFKSVDKEEGVSAFIEKRKPNFTGKA